MKIVVPPPLRDFLDIANQTSTKVLAETGPGLRLVHEVDVLIRERLWDTDIQLEPMPMYLAISSYFSFLGAVRIALSGQFAAIFPLIRHSLECACYAYRMAKDPTVVDVWLRRHQGKQENKACRKIFSSAVTDVGRSVAAKQEELGKLVSDLYRASIDFGAHPNSWSVVSHISVEEADEHYLFKMACLYGEDDPRIQQGLVACAENGIASAFVVALAAKDHPLIDAEFTALAVIYARVQEVMATLQGDPAPG